MFRLKAQHGCLACTWRAVSGAFLMKQECTAKWLGSKDRSRSRQSGLSWDTACGAAKGRDALRSTGKILSLLRSKVGKRSSLVRDDRCVATKVRKWRQSVLVQNVRVCSVVSGSVRASPRTLRVRCDCARQRATARVSKSNKASGLVSELSVGPCCSLSLTPSLWELGFPRVARTALESVATGATRRSRIVKHGALL